MLKVVAVVVKTEGRGAVTHLYAQLPGCGCFQESLSWCVTDKLEVARFCTVHTYRHMQIVPVRASKELLPLSLSVLVLLKGCEPASLICA